MKALPNAEGQIFKVTPEIMEQGKALSKESERRRIIFPLHRKQAAPVQRMLNFFQPGTYITPHRHPMHGASETMMMLSGKLGFLHFSESGEVVNTYLLEQGDILDFEPMTWHAMVALAEDTVILEIKKGPYDFEKDKQFAPWALSEGDEGCDQLIEEWGRLFG